VINAPVRKIFALLVVTTSFVGCAKQVHTETPPDRIKIAGTSDKQPEKIVEGYVDLEFTVNEHGVVENPVVLESTHALFEPAAIKAALKFEYKPRIVDGQPVAVSGVRTRITFELENETEEAEKD
jgi:TonB family protein